jgi:hypothetical protein
MAIVKKAFHTQTVGTQSHFCHYLCLLTTALFAAYMFGDGPNPSYVDLIDGMRTTGEYLEGLYADITSAQGIVFGVSEFYSRLPMSDQIV